MLRDLPTQIMALKNEGQFRVVLEHRYGMSHEYAQECGICLVNLWCPVERPAYKNPLVLMDCSTMKDLEQETIRWKLRMDIDNGYDYQVESSGRKHPRPMRERVPQAAKDAPAYRLYITQAIDMFTFQICKKTRLLFLSK